MAIATTVVAQTPASAVKPDHSASASVLKLERERMDGVVAAALVTALSEQLGGRAVNIRLEHVDAQATSLRDRLVKGQGRMLIDGGDDWIAFRFDVLYDAVLESAGYPELHIGGVGRDERAVPNDAKLIREMDDRVVAMLGEEFGYQQVRLQLDRIVTVEAGTRYLRVDADGIADFGLDGTSPLRVEALYDRKAPNWLRIAYVLQPSNEASGSGLMGH
ncbi:MAG: hypothetical protein E6Q88_06280 [Lysobacteraceae bacterium]|nr:MAG: hypothetical protein E6Q88_06280 [Xanthomonadaceae bacterium]